MSLSALTHTPAPPESSTSFAVMVAEELKKTLKKELRDLRA